MVHSLSLVSQRRYICMSYIDEGGVSVVAGVSVIVGMERDVCDCGWLGGTSQRGKNLRDVCE